METPNEKAGYPKGSMGVGLLKIQETTNSKKKSHHSFGMQVCQIEKVKFSAGAIKIILFSRGRLGKLYQLIHLMPFFLPCYVIFSPIGF